VTAVLLGVLVEVLQHFVGRDAELGDVGRDALGAVTAAGGLLVFDLRVRASPARHALRGMAFLVAVGACVLMLVPMGVTAAAYLQRYVSFPTLVDFGSNLSTYFLGVPSAVAAKREALPIDMPGGEQGVIGLHARLGANKRGWLAVWEPYSNWRDYDRLALDLANPTDVPLLLQVRVRDHNQGHDRQAGCLGTLAIAPQSRRTVVISLRELASATGRACVDTKRVYSIFLIEDLSNSAQDFYVMRIWLE